MVLMFVRALFMLVAAGLGVHLAFLIDELNEKGDLQHLMFQYPLVWFILMMAIALAIVVFDIVSKEKQIATISAFYVGLIVGLILTLLLRVAFEPVLPYQLVEPFTFSAMAALCYLSVSLLLQTKDDFRFIIPYVEFSREIKGAKPYLLDTSVIIDGRIADICETQIIDNQLVVPRFVLNELQAIADSADKLKRNRGRRGLDMLNRLQNNEKVDIEMHEVRYPEVEAVKEVDQKLVVLGKRLDAKVCTNDYNLNKVAKLQGVEVININDVANAFRPVVLPGETMRVKLIKPGEEHGQGIGYLEDGTMVVCEHGRDHIGEDVDLMVTSVLQTSAGRMIFGKLEGGPNAGRRERS